MATDTVPAAEPGPNDPPDSNLPGGPVRGLIAQALAAEEVARPVPDQGSAASTDGGGDSDTHSAPPGVTSAAYHAPDEGGEESTQAAGSRYKQSVWKELCLAGVKRWAKGGGTENKRLDLQKAQAQANQTKTAKTVTISSSGGLPSRGGSGGGSAAPNGKSMGSKSPTGGTEKGPKNSRTDSRQGPSGRSGSGSGASPVGSGGGGKGNPGKDGPKNGGGKSPKSSKGDGRIDGSGGGKNGHSPGASKGKDGSGSSGGGKSTKEKDTGSGKSGASGSSPGGGPARKGSSGKNGAAGSKGSSGGSGPGSAGKDDGRNGKQPLTGADGKPYDTQKSRETGHGDGVRANRVYGHIKAYGRGVKDGWGDQEEVRKKDEQRLDQAHATWQQDQAENEKEEQGMGKAAVATPLEVKKIDASKLTLGNGKSLERKEVRTYKGFQRRLEAKSAAMQQVAEATKALQAAAEEQAKEIQQLVEDAKGVKGGEKLIGHLEKLVERATIQAGKAEELHKRAVRAADACKALIANIETRYQPLYQAIVDSDESTSPELRFFRDAGYTKAA
ncbi:hypothetical protein OG453_44555 [Streptomyces sp. NBC_01381]|uniref:hypothetical protein n=1 Tax=Streptomyces sp. NBC_01381 TaxID=2903845 RepID=UPI00225AAC91|nr:hypothetical protein [Streptomyces sp. NBC_01381]MCX4673631.1 hypothetical protein [Streptomyces sp. NBC_01381]